MNINPDEMITTPIRTLEVLAQGLRESVRKTDEKCGDVSPDDYTQGFRDALLLVLDGLEKVIVGTHERELQG